MIPGLLGDRGADLNDPTFFNESGINFGNILNDPRFFPSNSDPSDVFSDRFFPEEGRSTGNPGFFNNPLDDDFFDSLEPGEQKLLSDIGPGLLQWMRDNGLI